MRGLRSKVEEFYTGHSAGGFDLIALTETNLNPEILSSELFSPDYTVFRRDRKFNIVDAQSGGGVLLATTSVITTEIVNVPTLDMTFPTIDIVICKCSILYISFHVVVVYIPPALAIDLFESFCEALEQLDCLQSGKVILLGDFNVPGFIHANNNDRRSCCLNNMLSIMDLRQFNAIINSTGRLLDLVISNLCCTVVRDLTPLVSEDISYHPALIICIADLFVKSNALSFNTSYKAYNFKKADYSGIYRTIFNTDWSFLDDVTCVDRAVSQVYELLYDVLDTHVPLYKSHKKRYPPWYNAEIIKNIKLKAVYHNKYKKSCRKRLVSV